MVHPRVPSRYTGGHRQEDGHHGPVSHLGDCDVEITIYPGSYSFGNPGNDSDKLDYKRCEGRVDGYRLIVSSFTYGNRRLGRFEANAVYLRGQPRQVGSEPIAYLTIRSSSQEAQQLAWKIAGTWRLRALNEQRNQKE